MRFKLLNKGINEEKSKLSRAQINRTTNWRWLFNNYIYIDKNVTNQMCVCLKWIVRYVLLKKIRRGLEPVIDDF